MTMIAVARVIARRAPRTQLSPQAPLAWSPPPPSTLSSPSPSLLFTSLCVARPAIHAVFPRRWSNASTPPPPPREKVSVELREEDLDESFVKGWGKGGQKINKVRNCVLLKHAPTGLQVRCQETRSLDGNRRIARRLLLQKLDDHVNGELSKRNLKISKLRKKKANRRSKSKQKYAATSEADDSGESGESDDGSDSDDGEDSEAEGDADSDGDEVDDDEDAVDVVDFDVDEHKFRPSKKKK